MTALSDNTIHGDFSQKMFASLLRLAGFRCSSQRRSYMANEFQGKSIIYSEALSVSLIIRVKNTA
jgi:hypothetical protein